MSWHEWLITFGAKNLLAKQPNDFFVGKAFQTVSPVSPAVLGRLLPSWAVSGAPGRSCEPREGVLIFA